MVDLTEVDSIEILEKGPERVAVRVARRFGDSAVEQVISLLGGSNAVDIETKVDWHERQRLLKLAFPLDVHADRAASEIQFGHVYRSIHTNTSWDSARFETCAHRWVHVGEAGYGVTVANDATYGHDITRSSRTGRRGHDRAALAAPGPAVPRPRGRPGGAHAALFAGGRYQRRRRGPRGLPAEPAAAGDRGRRTGRAAADRGPPGIVVEAVKLAEDRTGDVIVRLYEAHGGRARGMVRVAFPVGAVTETDLLERQLADASALRTGSENAADGIVLELRPFQIVTLRLTRL